jgi:hypothetical protein
MNITGKSSLVCVLVLLFAAPALAGNVPEGDYYAPTATVIQQPTSDELKAAKEGDFYSPGKTIVQQPTAQELNQAKQGDFYAPVKSH